MKRNATKWIGLLLVVALLAGLFPTAVLADAAARSLPTEAEVRMVSVFHLGTEETDVCYYSDDWFLEDSSELNYALATLSAQACAASFSDTPDRTGIKISDLLTALGFSDIELNDYYKTPIMLEDSFGCLAAHRTIEDAEGNEFTLLAVFPRNAGYEYEWMSDFDIGAAGAHEGFNEARDEVLRFLKQYIGKHEISGDLKVWGTGYSRGAGAANLVGGFLAEDTGYFGADVSIAPEDIFFYTIGTPRTITTGLKKSEVLNVSTARTGEQYADTPGETFAYAGTDGVIDPAAAQYAGIHNFTALGDYITKLPSEDWGFTCYGTTTQISYDDPTMLDWLALFSPETAEALRLLPEGYATEIPAVTVDVDSASLVPTGETISPDGLITRRLKALEAMSGGREGFIEHGTDKYLGAFACIYGTDWENVHQNIQNKENRKLMIKAGALNYLAYAQALQGEGVSDAKAVSEAVQQILETAGIKQTAEDHETYSVQNAIADVLNFLLNEPTAEREQTIKALIPADYLPLYASLKAYMAEEGLEPTTLDGLAELAVGWAFAERETIQPIVRKAVPEKHQAIYDGICAETAAYADYLVENDVALPTTVDGIIATTVGFLRHVESYPTTMGLLKQGLALVPAETRPAVVQILSGGFPASEEDTALAKALLGEEAAPEDIAFAETVFAVLRACVEGNKDMNMTAQQVRSSLILMATGLLKVSTIGSLIYYGDFDVKFTTAVKEALDLVLSYKDPGAEAKTSHTLIEAADASLADLLTALGTEKTAEQVALLTATPAKLRAIAMTVLFGAETEYSVKNEVAAAATFLNTIPLVAPAHFHELYTAWLKAQNPACMIFESNGGSDVPAQLVQPGALAEKPADPKRGGYSFDGWFKDAERTTPWNFDTDRIGKLCTVLYAKWSYNSPAPSGGTTSGAVTVPVTGDENTIAVSATVSGATAAIKQPTTQELEKIIGASVRTGEVTIDVSGLGGGITKVAVPTEMMKAISNAVNDEANDAAALTLKLAGGSVELDAAALTAIMAQAGGSDVTVGLEQVRQNALSAVKAEAVAALDVRAVYEASVTSGGVPIHDFRGGKAAVKVGAPLKEGEDPRGVVLYYVAEDGTKTRINVTCADGYLIFEVAHFSTYVVSYDAQKGTACPRDASCPISAFTDADPAAWYHDGVHYVLETGIMQGLGDGSFLPDGTTSRAMAAMILWNLEGRPAMTGGAVFADVAADAWYADAVRWAAGTGVVTGWTEADGTRVFSPEADVTREQFAAMLYRYAKLRGEGFTGLWSFRLDFPDAADAAEWAYEPLCWMVMRGVINGMDGRLNPQGTATRAQVANMLYRFAYSA